MNPLGIEIGGLLGRAEEAFFLLNERGAVVYLNPSLGKLVGVAVDDPSSWGSLGSELLRIPEDLPTGQARLVQRPWGEGNSRRWLNILFLPLREADGRLLGLLGQVGEGKPPQKVPKSSDSLVPERLARLREEQMAQWGFEALPAHGQAMRRVLNQVELAIQTPTPVALIGEPGVGKSSLARVIHHQSLGVGGTFTVLDCQSVPADLLRSQLLGRGETPNPKRPVSSLQDQGLLSSLGPGTLLIRAPLSLPTDIQQALVRANGTKKSDWRLIVTEREPLEPALDDGRLLESFYYLISTLLIDVPPLRERKEELLDCCAWILDRLGPRLGKPALSLDPNTLEVLRRYDWPGNLRELETVLEQATRQATGLVLMVRDLPRRLRRPSDPVPPSPARDEKPPPLDRLLEEVERRMITLALRKFNGNKSKAANHLGISRARLHRRADQLGLSGST